MSTYEDRYEGYSSLNSSAQTKGGGGDTGEGREEEYGGGSSPYDAFEDRHSQRQEMEVNVNKNELVEEEEEFVFLDLTEVCGQTDIPANAPYVLSGLDMQNPVLIIDNKLKLVGEYQETIGTHFIFSETVDSSSVVHEETGRSDVNLFTGKCIIDPNQTSTKQVKPIARLHKILKFSVFPKDDNSNVTEKIPASSK